MKKILLWKHLLASCLCSFFFLVSSLAVEAQTTLYVNDGSTAGDAYTSATGSDALGTGSQSAPYATIAKAMSVIATGAIYVDAGTYNEGGFSIRPFVKLVGLCPASSKIVLPTTSTTVNVLSNAELSRFTITRVPPTVAAGQVSSAVATETGGSNMKINNCFFTLHL